MLHWSERYFWYNQPRRPLGIGGGGGGGGGKLLLVEIITLSVVEPTQTV